MYCMLIVNITLGLYELIQYFIALNFIFYYLFKNNIFKFEEILKLSKF